MTSRILEAAADYQEAWHANHPKGCTVAAYVNDQIPGDIFQAGAEWMLDEVLRALGEQNERVPDNRWRWREAPDWLESRFKGE